MKNFEHFTKFLRDNHCYFETKYLDFLERLNDDQWDCHYADDEIKFIRIIFYSNDGIEDIEFFKEKNYEAAIKIKNFVNNADDFDDLFFKIGFLNYLLYILKNTF